MVVPQQAQFFSYPNTITLITPIKTPILANLGCLDKPKITAPTEKAPSDSPPSESTWVSDSPPPLFFLTQTALTATAPEVHFAVGTQNQGECPLPPSPGQTLSRLEIKQREKGDVSDYEICDFLSQNDQKQSENVVILSFCDYEFTVLM